MNTENIIWPPSGKYVLAVSGGVDSMVLLDVFTKAASDRNYELIVAHFDHGMREDSTKDAKLVEGVARKLGLMLELGQAQIDLSNEATARAVRYDFLGQLALKSKAAGIITAHHQDDLIETSLLNLARGSRRIGLAPFSSNSPLRPLRDIPRSDILAYAKMHNIVWHEDETNSDTSNPRNFVRHKLLASANPAWRAHYLSAIDAMSKCNTAIEAEVAVILKAAKKGISYSFSRAEFLRLSLDESSEIIMAIARKLAPGVELDQRLVEELVVFAKTAKPGRLRPLRQGIELRVSSTTIEITPQTSAV